jgi:MFS family permease
VSERRDAATIPLMAEPAGSRFSYGWVVLAVSVVVVALGTGILFTLGVFLGPIVDAMGWSRGSVSAIAGANWIVMGIGSQLWGALSDRIGSRRVALLGGLVLGLGLVLSSRVIEVWQFYLTFSLIVGLGVGAFYAPLSATATRWFTTNRGLALGIVSSGIGIGILVTAPLSRWLIEQFGWRTAMLLLGDLAWVVIVPASLLLRNGPADVGAGSVGAPARGGSASPAIYGSPAFWAIALTHFACCAAHSGPIFHMVTYASDRGVSPMVAATILGASGFSSIAGRIGCGILADRFGAKRTLITGLILQAVMVLLYRFAVGVTTFYALAAVFGMAYGGVMPLYALIVRERFGERVMGRAYGGVFFISSLGMGLGSYAGGWFFDHLGSYAWLYLGSFLIGAAAAVLAFALRPPRPLVIA